MLHDVMHAPPLLVPISETIHPFPTRETAFLAMAGESGPVPSSLESSLSNTREEASDIERVIGIVYDETLFNH